MRNLKRLMALALALALCLALDASALAEAEDPVVVRVGAFSYLLSVVQTSLGSVLDVASLLSGQPVTDEDRQAGVEATIEKFINMGLIECKLAEKGKDDFTEAEQEIMKSAAQSKYEELWQTLYQRAPVERGGQRGGNHRLAGGRGLHRGGHL